MSGRRSVKETVRLKYHFDGCMSMTGILAHESPVRDVAARIAALDPHWVHAMHGGTLTREALPYFLTALRDQEFAYCGMLLGRELPTGVPA